MKRELKVTEYHFVKGFSRQLNVLLGSCNFLVM